MVPIVLSVLDQLHESSLKENGGEDSTSIIIESEAYDSGEAKNETEKTEETEFSNIAEDFQTKSEESQNESKEQVWF